MVFFILICCQLQNHATSGVSQIFRSFLCLLSLILQYYSFRSYTLFFFCSLFKFCMWVLFYIVFSLPQALQLDATDSFIYYGCLSQFLMLMVDVLVNSFVFAEVIATTVTLENINHIFLIHHLSPNHD